MKSAYFTVLFLPLHSISLHHGGSSVPWKTRVKSGEGFWLLPKFIQRKSMSSQVVSLRSKKALLISDRIKLLPPSKSEITNIKTQIWCKYFNILRWGVGHVCLLLNFWQNFPYVYRCFYKYRLKEKSKMQISYVKKYFYQKSVEVQP